MNFLSFFFSEIKLHRECRHFGEHHLHFLKKNETSKYRVLSDLFFFQLILKKNAWKFYFMLHCFMLQKLDILDILKKSWFALEKTISFVDSIHNGIVNRMFENWNWKNISKIETVGIGYKKLYWKILQLTWRKFGKHEIFFVEILRFLENIEQFFCWYFNNCKLVRNMSLLNVERNFFPKITIEEKSKFYLQTIIIFSIPLGSQRTLFFEKKTFFLRPFRLNAQ